MVARGWGRGSEAWPLDGREDFMGEWPLDGRGVVCGKGLLVGVASSEWGVVAWWAWRLPRGEWGVTA